MRWSTDPVTTTTPGGRWRDAGLDAAMRGAMVEPAPVEREAAPSSRVRAA